MKSHLLLAIIPLTFIGCTDKDYYPSAWEASFACDQWEEEYSEDAYCMPDRYLGASQSLVHATAQILGLEKGSAKVLRRFIWKVQ